MSQGSDQESMSPEKKQPPAPSLLRSSGVVGIMTMFSRVLGLVRDMVIANLFGASAGADAFFVAFKIPNFMRRLFAEGAFSQAFVPVLSEYRARRSHEEVRTLVKAVSGSLGVVLLLLTLIAVVGATGLTWIFAPGFHDDPVKFQQTTEMLRLTFPYLLLISMTALAGGILNSYDRFAVPAFTPVLLNLSLIGSAWWLSAALDNPIYSLAWGVVIAGVSQLLFQLPFLARLGLLTLPVPNFSHPGVKRIMKLMVPAMFGVSVSQINLLLDTVLASFLETGSVSWLYYSDRLSELPLGVFGIAIATVILPSLSRRHTETQPALFSRTLDWALRLVLMIGFPAALALMLLSTPLISTLFYHGALTARDVHMASLSLQAYSLGLLAFMLVKVLAPGYFARQDTRTPVRYGLIAMALNMVFNLILIFPLAHVGLALATTLSASLNAWLLWYGLRKQTIYLPQPGWLRYFAQILVGLLALSAFIFWRNPGSDWWLEVDAVQRILKMAELCIGGVLVYVLALVSMGIRFKHLKMQESE